MKVINNLNIAAFIVLIVAFICRISARNVTWKHNCMMNVAVAIGNHQNRRWNGHTEKRASISRVIIQSSWLHNHRSSDADFRRPRTIRKSTVMFDQQVNDRIPININTCLTAQNSWTSKHHRCPTKRRLEIRKWEPIPRIKIKTNL